MRGSVLVTFDELVNDRGIDQFQVSVNGQVRDLQFTDINNYYSTFCFPNDTVEVRIDYFGGATAFMSNFSVTRIDFTTDDEGGDNGIKETIVYPRLSVFSNLVTTFSFDAVTTNTSYNFHYKINITTLPRTSFSQRVGYDASNPIQACINYNTSPSTVYTTSPTLDTGVYVFTTTGATIQVSNGYYSDGTNVWYKGTELPLLMEAPCVIPTPTPTMTPTSTPTPTLTPTPTPTPEIGGDIITFTVYQGQIYNSQNSGTNFNAVNSNRNWTDITMDYSGSIQYAVVGRLNNGIPQSVYRSTNTGSSFTQVSDIGRGNWFDAASSSDAKHVLLSSLTYLAGSGSLLLSTNDYGSTWTQNTSLGQPVTVAVSETGQYQSVFSISGSVPLGYTMNVSSNSGSTFNKISSFGQNSTTLFMSANGQYQTSAGGFSSTGSIINSSDYGSTWTTVFEDTNLIGGAFYNGDMSLNGQYQYIANAGNNKLLKSSNYGISGSWSTIIDKSSIIGGIKIHDVSTNFDGRIVMYLEESGSFVNVYKSMNYASSFDLIFSSSIATVNDSENIKISKY